MPEPKTAWTDTADQTTVGERAVAIGHKSYLNREFGIELPDLIPITEISPLSVHAAISEQAKRERDHSAFVQIFGIHDKYDANFATGVNDLERFVKDHAQIGDIVAISAGVILDSSQVTNFYKLDPEGNLAPQRSKKTVVTLNERIHE